MSNADRTIESLRLDPDWECECTRMGRYSDTYTFTHKVTGEVLERGENHEDDDWG